MRRRKSARKRCYVCDEYVADKDAECRVCGSVATYRGDRMARRIMAPLPEERPPTDVLPGTPVSHRRRGHGPD